MLERQLEVSCDPLSAFAKVSDFEGVVLLHSGLQAYGLGRYSILAALPQKRIRCRRDFAWVQVGTSETRIDGNPFEVCRRMLEGLEIERMGAGSLPFYGGLIGYFAYDSGRALEPDSLGRGSDEMDLARFHLYRGALVFDHRERRVWMTCLDDRPDDDLLRIAHRVCGSGAPSLEAFEATSSLSSNFEKGDFCGAVDRVRELILEGEVYQVNLSQRFEATCAGSSADLFLRLAVASPAPYGAYLDFGDEQIVSSSPERFLHVEDGVAQTRPIKGTRPRGDCEEETLAYERDLSCSEKDRSELLMIVDLERNDLGRVCRPGSVRVERLFSIERYATVLHQTADVVGELEPGLGVMDCVRAMFPGGSITGAPKIRSMQVIEDLERGERGVYTGSIGYLAASGNADLNIAIRTIRVSEGRLSFQVGGGIVWDSDPESEYEETLLKAKAMIKAIGGEHA
ncbi:aminodeoxychorismate synthase component I [Pelagicoccus sp. SDUM812003]|uniref:aminodeoxychorismate synthase component I n=1 Tax=Pelagicoccus sp. SDUM812003 TaxID=3041267 RepID=UPI00280F3BEE|nr:aminodeoxychorismate synthase component I [Pelagicoccus sp. SDUM812003]MDQ8201598.1 aminodeoxychorismate synthase component I [Pelagicoccus sp. SDUM812003]